MISSPPGRPDPARRQRKTEDAHPPMPHRALKLLVHQAEPYLERARWILDRIDELAAGDEVVTDAARRIVKELGERRITERLRKPVDWLSVANELIAESVVILERRETPASQPAGGPPRRGVPSAGPPPSRPRRGAPTLGPPHAGPPKPRSARAR